MVAVSMVELTKSIRAGAPGCSARVSVLREVELVLWPGELVAVEGSVGCGISTLLRCAAGLSRPDSGAIRWFGARAPARGEVAYVSARSDDGQRSGALYAAVDRAIEGGCAIVLADDLHAVGAIERRLAFEMLRRHSAAGAAVMFAASDELASSSFVSRVLTLEHGALTQRRKRSAVRIAASSPLSRARASARSTYGRSLRSPQ